MDNQMVAEDIFSANVDSLVKRRSSKSVVTSIVTIIVALALFVGADMLPGQKDSSMYFLMMLSAVVLVGVGIVRLLFFGKEYVYLPTKSKIAEYSVFFRSDAKRAVIDAIESGNIAALDKIKKDDNSGIRFDIVMSDDCKFASCQVFEWVPHFFEPASKVYVLDEETVSKIRDYIEREHVSPVN